MKILRSRVEAAFTGKGTAADVKTVTDAFAINKVEGLVVCDILLAQLAGQPFFWFRITHIFPLSSKTGSGKERRPCQSYFCLAQ
ncbi:hypothetical protein RU95_GL000080 [Enterococcus avium]|nr:hypothetical protein RU95_GL000080 [Enterococcus avium]